MLANKEGITRSPGLPTVNQTQAYQAEDVLVSNIRPYFRKIWFANRDGGCSNDVLVLRAKETCVPGFLYYLLSDNSFFDYAAATGKGTKMPRGDKGAIMRYAVPDVPLDAQIGIAGTLSALDARIVENRKINHHLEQMAQTIYKSWFVDFEPWGGVMPSNWHLISLADIMDYAGGSQPPASEFISEDIEGYIRFVQIRDYETDAHITYIPVSAKNKLCTAEDIMLARYGAALGRICYGIDGAYNVALAKVSPRKPEYREFLRCFLTSDAFYEGLNKKGNRSAQSGFNRSDIKSFALAFPGNDDILVIFETTVGPLFQLCLHNKKENARLAALRDTLLPRLMSGELSIQGA